jgi:regulator of protease activity HflC (stomatin/prohibitin superfamily)
MQLAELPHFNNAGRYLTRLAGAGVVFAGLGLALTGAVSAHANAYWRPDLPIPRALGFLGAAFLIAAAGLLSAAVMVFVRQRMVAAPASMLAPAEDIAAVPTGAGRTAHLQQLLAKSRALLRPGVETLAAWPQALLALLFGALGLAGIEMAWRISAASPGDPNIQQIVGGVLIVAAFPLLVLERSFASLSADMLPEAPQVDRLLRVSLFTSLGLGIASIIRSLGFDWAPRIDQVIAILIAIIAIELIVRSLAVAFVPFAPIELRRAVADSSLAGLLRFSLPSFQAFNTAVRQQLGIDLSRSWALAFVRRASIPIVLGMAVMTWAVTGITALSLNERAVYERMGVPVAVLGPGLHFHLPWPLGVLRRVEFGVIHDIPIAMSSLGDLAPRTQSSGVDQRQQVTPAEAAPPSSADRLWDASHPSEQSYLIASQSPNGQQSFQIADADLRVVYRVGMTDGAALDSAYKVANPETLIMAATGQLLVRYFSRTKLLDVIGQSRDAFTAEFRNALQDELDRMSSGIEAIAVVVEAIHPPAGAAAAYHNVQAAEILANSQIAVQRASAIHSTKSAEQSAVEDRNKAAAAATELTTQARSESILFDADRQARARNGTAFLFERRIRSPGPGAQRHRVPVRAADRAPEQRACQIRGDRR